MSSLKRSFWFRRFCLALSCLLCLQAAAGVARASSHLTERSALRAMGLLDAVICHGDPLGRPAGHTTGEPVLPGEQRTDRTACDCCLTGCGAGGVAALPAEHGALVRPLRAANAAAIVALDAASLRTFLSERTRDPRSPPMPI